MLLTYTHRSESNVLHMQEEKCFVLISIFFQICNSFPKCDEIFWVENYLQNVAG